MNNKLLPVLFLMLCATFLYGQFPVKTLLFVGSYTGGRPALGIYVYEFNAGKLKQLDAVTLINPSFITLSPNGRYLYACTETKTPGAGSVAAFKIDSVKGQLTFLNKQPAGGENPVYVAVDKHNRFVLNANYTEGSASLFTVNNDGSLNPASQIIQFTGNSIDKNRQDKPHVHAAVFSPANDYVFFPDLGTDKLRVFSFDSTNVKPLTEEAQLTVNTVPGSGPRHFTFHPSGKFAYCIEELSGTISAYAYHHGKLDSIQHIFSYSKKHKIYGSADIHLSPDGLFLYASNRVTENTLSIFSVDQLTGKLTLAGHQSTHGQHPRNFTMDPTGNFLLVANVTTGNIVIFKRNTKTGLLTRLKEEAHVPNPSCLQMRTYYTEKNYGHK